MPARPRIALVDDHPVVRIGLRHLIAAHRLGQVTGEASTLDGARQLLHEGPDLLVLDLVLGDELATHGLEAMCAGSPGTRVLVVSALDEDVHAEACVRAGARGYLSKGCPPSEVVAAIRTVLAGDVHLGTDVLRRIARRVAGGGRVDDPLASLSPRQRQVFDLLGEGLRPSAIAARLDIETKTVEAHLGHLKRKLGLASTFELFRFAVRTR